MLLRKCKYYFFIFAFATCSIYSAAQIFPSNIVWEQNFGKGTSDPNVVGPPVTSGHTDFTYSNSICPPAGSYSIVWATPGQSCFGGEWIFLVHDRDHELNPLLDYGMFMLVNDTTTSTNKTVYVDTVKRNFCNDVKYRFSFSVINVDVKTDCTYGPDFPVFEYRLEDGNGQLIKKDTTRPGVAFVDPPDAKHFSTYYFDFTIPAGVTTLIPKLSLLHSTYWCGEDFAVDGIMITTQGPSVKIAFDNEPASTVVKSVCFQQNETISLTGHIDSFYTKTALQWQQSTDDGVTWSDIAGAADTTYSRSLSVPDSILFRLTAAEATNIGNPDCRVVSKSLRVEVNGIPDSISVTSNSPVCSGSDLQFNATGGASYVWSGPNGFSDNIPFPHIFSSSLSDSGIYYADILTLGGCIARDSTHVTMIGTDVHAWPDTAICKGLSVRLIASKGTSYSWTPPNGLSNTSVINPIAKPDVTTTYIVKVTDKDGCSDTAKIKITVRNSVELVAGISGTDYLCRPYDSASFNDISAGKIINWSWSFGNGQTDTTNKPPTQYYSIPDNEDDYIVRFAVTDTAGCTDTTYHITKVARNCYVAVPTAFTPNGDGLNDYLYPLNAYKATNLVFRVYNRNGQLVFETRDWSKKWDGTLRGVQQASGVYVWTLEYNDASNKKISLKGTSALIR